MNVQEDAVRAARLATLSASAPSAGTFRIGACMVNGRTGLLEAPGRTLRLRRKELELLYYLYQCSPTPVDREQLLREVWRCPNAITRTVDQTVATLRRKLEFDAARPQFLLTVHGVGYRLVSFSVGRLSGSGNSE